MSRKYRVGLLVLLVAILAAFAVHYLMDSNIAVLNPKGPVAAKERNLIVFALALSLVVVIPVFTMTGLIAWRYREGNTKAKYSPGLEQNALAETTWWLIPSVLISILAVVAWRSSYALAPTKPLVSNTPPIAVQVVAMDWKWLFIYPQQNIASVNSFDVPVNTPISFQITSDAPMNSFWIPQLGGQIYAMAGMNTQLQLEASQPGSYYGSSANISGSGFAGMHFTVKAVSRSDFNKWVSSVQSMDSPLSLAAYNQLARPSENNPVAYYSAASPGLYGNVVMKYLMPGLENYVQ